MKVPHMCLVYSSLVYLTWVKCQTVLVWDTMTVLSCFTRAPSGSCKKHLVVFYFPQALWEAFTLSLFSSPDGGQISSNLSGEAGWRLTGGEFLAGFPQGFLGNTQAGFSKLLQFWSSCYRAAKSDETAWLFLRKSGCEGQLFNHYLL